MKTEKALKIVDGNIIDKDGNIVEIEQPLDDEYNYRYECIAFSKEELNQIEQDKKLLNWLIEKMYVAGGLIELKVCPLNNPTIPKWHNGIETHDSRFNDFISRINELKRGIK